MKQFKIRGSAGWQIMTEPQGNTPMEVYLNAVDKVKELQSLQDGSKNKETKTYKDRQVKINELNHIVLPILKQNKDGVLLSVTCLTYLQIWVKEQLYNRKKEFTSKQTDKGNTVELDAIDFAASVYGWGMVSKNTTRFENGWMTGEPDLVLAELVPDLKASYDPFTFPLFETELDKKYYWQDQIYMSVTEKSKSATIYTLMDTPEHIIEMEAKKISYKAGYLELDATLYDEVREFMTYSNLPTELRIKRFDVDLDNSAIDNIKDRVDKCRWYLDRLTLPNGSLISLQLKQTA